MMRFAGITDYFRVPHMTGGMSVGHTVVGGAEREAPGVKWPN